MSDVPVNEVGLVGVVTGALYLLLRWEISRKTNGSASKCEAFRRDLQDRMIRLEEQLKHVLQMDLPESHSDMKAMQQEIKALNSQILDLQRDIIHIKGPT